MEKVFYLIRKNHWQDIVSKLVSKYSLPEINYDLAIYFKNKKVVFEIDFHNNKCFIRSYNKSLIRLNEYLDQIKSTPAISIENKNIKYFLKICHQLGLNKANINQIVRLDFYHRDKLIVSVELGTMVGDMMVVGRDRESDVCSLLDTKDCFLERLNGEKLDQSIAKKHLKTEEIFNSLGIPNQVIQNYADRFAIDLTSGTKTLSHKITAKSNDYGIYEKYFEILTQSKLDSNITTGNNLTFFKPLSIIIASFNSDNTIIKVLRSIESQNLNKNQKQLLDVIIVDDGSKRRVQSIVKKSFKEFSFRPRILRFEENQGLSSARNLGFRLSKYDYVLFIDSDILLSNNYLYEHSIRLQTIPNAIFISFKENIQCDGEFVGDENISRGLMVSSNLSDKRLFRLVAEDTRWPNKTVSKGVEELLGETALFKNFGYGRTINGCYDLPSMVIGHNMSMRKDLVNAVGGFSDNFSGWGLEDAFFGAKAIAQGNFIIPVLATSVYHINHPPRSGSSEKQLHEHHKNTQVYNSLIHEQL